MAMDNQRTDSVQQIQNVDAERAVIGAVLISQDVFHECRLELLDGSREFSIHRLGWIWDACEDLIRSGEPIDPITLSDKLDRLGTLDEVGGPAFIAELMASTPSSLNARSYAAIIHDCYVRRQVVESANKIASSAYDMSITLQEVAGASASALNSAIRKSSGSQMVTMAESIAKVDAMIEANRQSELLPGIQTPLIDLTKLMGGGAQKQELNLIAGRPGQGKTTLLMQIALYAAKYAAGQQVRKHKVAVFSLEMPHHQLTTRLLSHISGIDYQRLRAGKFADNEYEKYYQALETLDQMEIFIDDKSRATPEYIRSRCEVLKSEYGIDMICVDSLNLMKAKQKFNRTDQEVDHCATELKDIARQFDVPVWAAHQMNRGIEYRGKESKPQLSDLQEGGEKPADGVFFLYHEFDDNKNITSSSVICAKQRSGPTGEIPVVFLSDKYKFENAVKIRL